MAQDCTFPFDLTWMLRLSVEKRLYAEKLTRSNSAIMTGLFGVSAGIFALYFFSQVPRVREDIIEPIPFIGEFFHKETPPEDNPF